MAVIIPCYNSAPYLPRALNSVFAQTYRDYSAYVIDDGSRDDTAAVLRSYADRVICLQQEHGGQAAARNHGIRLSNGPYVAFLDADDEWLPEKLERQVARLREAPSVGMVYSDCSTSGDGPSAGSYFARIGVPAAGRVFESLLKTCAVYTPTVIVRRDCLLDVGLFDESLSVGEDYNLWLRIAARWEVEVISEVLAIRHITPGSLTRTTNREHVASNVITVFEKLEKMCPKLGPQERHALQVAIGWRCYGYGAYTAATSTAWSPAVAPQAGPAASASASAMASGGDLRTPVGGLGVGSFVWPGGWTLTSYGCFRTDTRLFCDFDTTNQGNVQVQSHILWSGAGGVNLVDDGGKITTRHNAFFVGQDGSQFSTAYVSPQPVRFIIEYDDVDPRFTTVSLILARERIQRVPVIPIDPNQPAGRMPPRAVSSATPTGTQPAGQQTAQPGAAGALDKAAGTVNNVNDQKKKAQSLWKSLQGAVQSH